MFIYLLYAIMRNIYGLFTIIVVLISCQNSKTRKEADENKNFFASEVETLLDINIPGWQSEYNVPCVGVGLIENGKIRAIRVYGNHQTNRKAPENTIFNVASITKVVTAMTVLKLVNNNQWNIDEPLFTYWTDPDIATDSLHKILTTRHILSHTTGFKNWRRMNPDSTLKFDFVPGEQYQYSGEGFEYLAKSLEVKFGKRIGELADSLIFGQLEMKDATFSWLSGKDTLRFAHWYDGQGNQHKAYYKTHSQSAADDLLITVEDMLKFGIASMDTIMINPSIFEEMVSTQSKIHNNADQGLGWVIVDDLPQDEYAINHDGGDIGVATTLILFPKSKNGITVFTNADNGRIICNNIIRKSIEFGDELIGKLYWGEPLPEIIKLPHNLLNEYDGKYKTNLDRVIAFKVEEDHLKIYGEGLPQLSIYPQNENTFFPLDFDIRFVFERNDDGKVISFKMIQNDKINLMGEKEY